MCTALSYKAWNFYFGRTLDFHIPFGEQITVTPRNLPFVFTNGVKVQTHPAIIGTALVRENYPLYFDACNEKGLGMAGLYFPHSAYYFPKADGGISSYEIIPYVLSQCTSVAEAKELLKDAAINDGAFSTEFAPSPMHWIIADGKSSVTVESMRDGLHIYDNPVGVLANEPPFDFHMYNLRRYRGLSAQNGENTIGDVQLSPYSLGFGGIGLPGDNSSPSRFVRAAFTKLTADKPKDDRAAVTAFFHMLGTVNQVRGCAKTDGGESEYTQYISCCNASKGVYYLKRYDSFSVQSVCLADVDLNGNKPMIFPFTK